MMGGASLLYDKLVSIISPCFNGGKYLDDYFTGILSQKHKNIELIFVNDGSTDDTEEKALKYGELLKKQGMRFKYIYQDNSGQAAAINKGLRLFSGDFLTWLDSDDIMLPENISKKLEFLMKNSEYGFAVSEIRYVNENDIGTSVGSARRIKPNSEDDFFKDLIYSHNVVWGPGTILVRREVVIAAIPNLQIYESREGQNWQLMLPITYYSKAGYVEEELLKVVCHNDSHSRSVRALEDNLKREESFIDICQRTIRDINGMCNSEKEYWCREVRIHHHLNCLRMSGFELEFTKYKSYRTLLLNDNYDISLKDSIILFPLRRVLSKVIHRK